MTTAEPLAAQPLNVPRSRAVEQQNSDQMILIAVAALAIVQLWFGLISSSLWLDETGTWWIVKDGPAQVISRAFSWSGQSPFFYLVAWLSSRVFGLSEFALRLPSVLAMSGALWFLFRIAERLFDRATAVSSTFIFLLSASFFAIDARPYALAMLCLTMCTWALLRWLDSGSFLDALIYVAAGTALIYAHCIMSLTLAVLFAHGVIALGRCRRVIAFAGMQVAMGLLSIPLLRELQTFYATRSAHSFAGAPGAGEIIHGLVPCGLIGAAILAVWLLFYFRGDVTSPSGDHRNLTLVAGWAFFAPCVLLLLPLFSDLHLFAERYLSSALPGQALLLGCVTASIRKPLSRHILLALLAVACILTQGRLAAVSHGGEDWKHAMPYLRNEAGNAPVLVVSGFVEASGFDQLEKPALRDILFAPALRYGAPSNTIRLPHHFDGTADPPLERIVRNLAHVKTFFLVTEDPSRNYELWLRGRLGAGCTSHDAGPNFGYVWVVRFTCQA